MKRTITIEGTVYQATTSDVVREMNTFTKGMDYRARRWALTQREVKGIGRIGYSGTKVHRFMINTFYWMGIRYFGAIYPTCGSRKFGSGIAAFTNDAATLTCLNCR